MFLGKASLLTIATALSVLGSACGVTLVQSEGTFIAFNAELGTLDDAPSNGTKFDVMAPPTGGSFGEYLSVESTPSSVSFDVDFLSDEEYTVYVRYRELVNNTPQISLTFDGSTTTSDLFVGPSTQFKWVHLNNLDLIPSGATPGLVETVTLSATSGSDFDIDAVALVRRSDVIGGGFTDPDASIPEGALTVPEPSSALLLLMGQLLFFHRRRS